MSDVFGSVYSDVYDQLYKDKDYALECDTIERIFERYANTPVKTILDLGCGTGNHSIELASRGFEVTGIDMSKDMLNAAKAKAETRNVTLKLHQSDIKNINLNKRFDAALMMFAVLGYQLKNEDVIAALKAARKHLHPDGLLIFDVWYGPGVLAQRPSERVKLISTASGNILRAASSELDIRHQICTVKYNLWQFSGNTLIAETREDHLMRFFFPQEIELLMNLSGLKLINLGSFPDFEHDIDSSEWNAMGICTTL